MGRATLHTHTYRLYNVLLRVAHVSGEKKLLLALSIYVIRYSVDREMLYGTALHTHDVPAVWIVGHHTLAMQNHT